ncbi:MAG: multicopper oxidase domain-containing protein [Bacteroidetes bacterium]|nr:multicopper oxidase domain-containing protein [Bacteroidota bacterium]
MLKYSIQFLILLAICTAGQGQTMKTFDLVGRQAGTLDLHDGQTIDLWGFKEGIGGNVTLPSPLLVVNEGDSVTINVLNQSSNPHTIHLHGLDVNQANDGVGSTSFDIPGINGTGTYKFKATYAGTYIYHCHVETVVHLQLGMYGAIVVKAANGANTVWTGGPGYTKDYTWVMSDVDKSWHDNIPMNGSLPGFEPDYFLINGKSDDLLNDTTVSIDANDGDTILVRLVNIGFTINEVIFPSGMNAKTVMSDGRAFGSSVVNDTVVVYPGERYDVLVDFSSAITDSIQVKYYDMYSETELYNNRVPLSATPPPPDPKITYGQNDDFTDGSTQDWVSGGANPNPPVNISSGGPGGASDAYLQIESNGAGGGGGAGGKLVTFNTGHWTGDYITEGVTRINMDVNNMSGPDLNMRLRIDGPGGTFYSLDSVHIPAGSGWINVDFDMAEGDLTGGSNYDSTMSAVANIWLWHSSDLTFPGPPSINTLGIDNMLATSAATFPVEWLSFKARPVGNQIKLTWETAYEQNNEGFEVEMARDDVLKNFNSIGFVEGAGNSSRPIKYDFLTSKLKPGAYLFRLQQRDYDGNVEYSDIVSIVMEGDLFASLYPNPVIEPTTTMEVNLPQAGATKIEIIDLFGRQVKSLDMGELSKGFHTFEVDLDDLSDGVYIYKVTHKLNSVTAKFMVLRG